VPYFHTTRGSPAISTSDQPQRSCLAVQIFGVPFVLPKVVAIAPLWRVVSGVSALRQKGVRLYAATRNASTITENAGEFWRRLG
jgi:hypothetical protein